MKGTREFFERLVNDESFAKETSKAKNFNELQKIAAGKGFDIKEEEYKKILAEAEKAGANLSDEALANISGGGKKYQDKIAAIGGDINATIGLVGNTVGSLANQVAGLVSIFGGLFGKKK